MSEPSKPRVPHQLTVWYDCVRETDESLLVWSYPHSAPHEIGEQRIRGKFAELPDEIRLPLNALIDSVIAEIPKSQTVRLPHTIDVPPKVTLGRFTLAIQDRPRAAVLPKCRLYYYEHIPEIPSKVEQELHRTRDQWSPDQLALAETVASKLKALAWQDYESRFGAHFHDRQQLDTQP